MQILTGALFLVVAAVVLALLVRLFENRIVFFPSRYPEGYWDTRSFEVKVDDVFFSVGDERIHGWYAAHPRAAGQILMCHGNAGNISDRLELLQLLHAQVPANIFIFDYRGYGRSSGSPSESGVYADAVAAFDWLRRREADLPVIVHGHSLGSAVAIDLATRRSEVAGLILESPFTNARDMARLMFGALPMHWFASMRWASDEKIGTLHTPKLFLHGEQDMTVPLRLGRKLYDSAPPPKEFVAIPRAGHNDLYTVDGKKYFESMRRFVEQCGAKNKSATENHATRR